MKKRYVRGMFGRHEVKVGIKDGEGVERGWDRHVYETRVNNEKGVCS